MTARDTGTTPEDEASSLPTTDTDVDGPDGVSESETPPGTIKLGPFLEIPPKWQMVLIGGIFVAINIMVMAIFLVAIILRR